MAAPLHLLEPVPVQGVATVRERLVAAVEVVMVVAVQMEMVAAVQEEVLEAQQMNVLAAVPLLARSKVILLSAQPLMKAVAIARRVPRPPPRWACMPPASSPRHLRELSASS